ncbi:MAG: HDIG domain-containing protein [Candidatus Krumholzibacteria bacterium]|nr:HDIG domain-containing protein [Candidatus Krumholzibacteria bacterium]
MIDQPTSGGKGETPDQESARHFYLPFPRVSSRMRLPLLYLAAFLALSLMLFPPTQKKKNVRFAEGDIADVDIISPFSFVVPLSMHEMELERARAAIAIPPVYVRDDGAVKHLPEDLAGLFERIGSIAAGGAGSVRDRVLRIKEAAPELRHEAVELLIDEGVRERILRESLRLQEQCIRRGIVNDATPLKRRDYERISVIAGGEESFVSTPSLINQEELGSIITSEARRLFPASEKTARLFYGIVRSYLVPNLIYDARETKSRRDEAMRLIERSFAVAKDERIIAKHDKVTRAQIEMLEAMEEKRVALDLASSYGKRIWILFGKGLRVLVLLCLLGLALRRFQPDIMFAPARLTLVFIILSLYLVLTALVMRLPSLDPYLIPISLVSLLCTAFFGIQAAVIFTIFASLLIITHTSLPASYAFISLFAGAAGIISIAHLRERKNFYTIFLYVAAAYVIGIAGFGFTEGMSLAGFLRSSLLGVANGLACSIMVMFILPIFESIFDATTDFTLMELSDLNRPLLRRLVIEAPGTYHHSLMVGNLVEAVAEEVGANGIQARVGAYYHDIGKLAKPEYFFENKGDNVNKHERLTPRMSALILASHVKEGIELAKREKLPRVVVDAIREHHGTTVMAYFYQRALEYDSHDSVNISDFRYPGPRPSSKETALIMLADSAEAAVRSLEGPTAPRIRTIVQKIIESRMNDGELDESGLTLNDIAVVREKFIQLLTGVFHSRIPYPSQRDGEELSS